MDDFFDGMRETDKLVLLRALNQGWQDRESIQVGRVRFIFCTDPEVGPFYCRRVVRLAIPVAGPDALKCPCEGG